MGIVLENTVKAIRKQKMCKTYVFSYIKCMPKYSSNNSAEGDLPNRLHTREGQCDFCLKCGGFRVFAVCGFDRRPSALLSHEHLGMQVIYENTYVLHIFSCERSG